MPTRRLAPTSIVLFSLLLVAAPLGAQGREYIQANYTKFEYEVPMRDGAKLFTAVYVPKDTSRPYPIMLERTPYSVGSYGADTYPERLGPSEAFAREGFIFAQQDVRGRFMSEGVFVDLRPHQAEKRSPRDIDEASDTWDTIDWLVKHVPNNNGRVGMSGISYNGFYVAAGMIDAHPALKAASPQAPIGDCYLGDDCYHNGVLWLPHNFSFYTFFQERSGGPARPASGGRFEFGTPDGYDYYMGIGPVANSKALLRPQNPYWNNAVNHTTYDDFWKARSITRFFRQLPPSVMTVGGWFDAEDLSGALRVFRHAETASADNHLVMGPWQHGGWAYVDGDRLGNLYFASKTGQFYREQIELPFFVERLKGKPGEALAKAVVFQTGSNRWRRFTEWPPRQVTPLTFYLGAQGSLAAGKAPIAGADAFDEYVSDPAKPVPFVGYTTLNVPSDYMTEDQRFAARRPDVLVYQTEPLTEDINVAGPIEVKLFVSTTGTDSDFVVKVIDVYPNDYPNPPAPAGGSSAVAAAQRPASNAVKMGGYQQLVRGEPFRGKFRNGFEKPEPFEPGKMTTLAFTMPDICHTFRKGHRLMVQVQSSWFPLGDRNPQVFTDIPNAKPSDFRKATQRVHRSPIGPSGITLLVER